MRRIAGGRRGAADHRRGVSFDLEDARVVGRRSSWAIRGSRIRSTGSGLPASEWLPSTWLSNALIDAARRSHNNPRDLPWLKAGKYLVVLVSNALLLHLGVVWLGKRVYPPQLLAAALARAKKPKLSLAWVDRVAGVAAVGCFRGRRGC